MSEVFLVIEVILLASIATAANNGTFPSAFQFGVVTSAYQTEGAWNEDGKGESTWDHWIHENTSRIKDEETADVSSDFYHHYKEDIGNACVYLGAKHYIFSISWSRILPNGLDNDINLKGILFYQEVINEIISYGMTPVAVLYHNDLPQRLQDIGGWTNPEMVNYFVNYARVAFKYFDKVKYWLTFNDPRSTCRLGYGDGSHAPGIALDGIADYTCAYVLLKSHAAVYHMYKDEFSDLQAKISIAIGFLWTEPLTHTDTDAADRSNQFEFGLYANPIYKGNWPRVVIDRVELRSKHENFTKSRLPAFTQDEIDYINGTFDFMAVTMLESRILNAEDIKEPEYGDPGYMKDMKVLVRSWQVYPLGVRNGLVWLKSTYNDPEIYIIGEGEPDSKESLDNLVDDNRITFYRQHLNDILKAINEDEVRVFAYAAKSLTDDFEWTDGYSERYGFYHVDFNDPNRQRTKKKSVDFYSELSISHQIPEPVTTSTSTYSTTTQFTTTTSPTTTDNSANRITFYSLIYFICNIFLLYINR